MVWTMIEIFGAWVKSWVITMMEQFMRELRGRIDNFKIKLGDKLWEAQVLDLSNLRGEVAKLRIEARALAYCQTLIIPFAILPIP